MAEWLNDLNQQQRQAVEAGDGPLVIVAGPGTGKTKTLTARIAHLLTNDQAKPRQILALTFTKKAADDLRKRLRTYVSPAPKVSTFHGLCYELLGSDQAFASDVERLQIIATLPRPKSLKNLSKREVALAISRAKNALTVEDPNLARLVRAYNKTLRDKDIRDFDDLLLDAHTLLTNDQRARETVQARYHYVLVDEFQDTNRLQYEVLKLLLGNDNLFVIGDPNQSIYGFRGASSSVFEQFKTDFPHHTHITLTTNYRSAPEVVRLSNAVFDDTADLVSHNQLPGQVRAVQVLNEYGEAAWVINQIQSAIGGGDFLKAVSDDDRTSHRRLNDFAVLYRSRSAATVFQKLLEESGLPYQVAGDGSPYDKPQLQALLALMRSALSLEGVHLEGYSKAQRHLLEQELAEIEQAIPSVLAKKLAAILGFETSHDLQQMFNVLLRFKDVPSALAYIDAIAEEGFYDPKADAITLLTIHASKGLEFSHVFLIGTEEGILPSGRGEEAEEHRLFYVAATRAKDRLEITHAKNRSGQPATASRFMTKVPHDILPRHVDPDMDDQIRRIAKRAAKRSQQSLF